MQPNKPENVIRGHCLRVCVCVCVAATNIHKAHIEYR